MKSRGVTIVVHVDGDPNTRKYHLPLWAFDAGKWGAVTLAVLVVLFFAFAEPLTHAAARVPGLEREIARLAEENVRVAKLAGQLNRAEANYQGLRQLLEPTSPDQGGGRAGPAASRAASVDASEPSATTPPAATPTPTPAPAPAPPGAVAPPPAPAPAPARAAAARYEAGPSEPRHWPLEVTGFVTRGQVVPGDPAESHPGIDVAVPEGSAVRAAGGGIVEQAGTDSAYGQFVLLKHPSGYESMYGHASRLMVQSGDSVQAGQVIALSGSSGRSTAPHLHFEIRLNGKTLDPLTMVKQEK
jgi:murein DD-endopeptidase MepM/ murein hydrolase activator NlpD